MCVVIIEIDHINVPDSDKLDGPVEEEVAVPLMRNMPSGKNDMCIIR